ncbi:hypothetical protein COOONC_09542 [Cooperia oncophora]
MYYVLLARIRFDCYRVTFSRKEEDQAGQGGFRSAAGDTSSCHCGSPSRPRRKVNLTGELFSGALEESKQGIHKVIRYSIPGQTLCYVFEHLRTTTQGNVVYRCTGCRKSGKTVSIAVVNEYNLVGDPVHLPHICMPWRNSKEKVERMVLEVAHDTQGF